MLAALVADAVFIAAVLLETVGMLSLLAGAYSVRLPEEFDPILASYHANVTPVLSEAAIFVPGKTPHWFADAYLIAAILFFLFFIKQARRAMSPYDEEFASSTQPAGRVERIIDWVVPPLVCALGALLSAATLLPFLTLPAALWLAMQKFFGKPSWFKLSASYYVNLLAVIGLVTVSLTLTR